MRQSREYVISKTIRHTRQRISRHRQDVQFFYEIAKRPANHNTKQKKDREFFTFSVLFQHFFANNSLQIRAYILCKLFFKVDKTLGDIL